MDIDAMIRQRLTQEASFAVSDLVETTGLTRQGLQGHLKNAMASGLIHRIGRGRGTRYERGDAWGHDRGAAGRDDRGDCVREGASSFERTSSTAGLDESEISKALLEWLDVESPSHTPEVEKVLDYAVSEIVNNAIDHSGAPLVSTRASVRDGVVDIVIEDEGMGVFERLCTGLGLDDHLHAIQELSKGRSTTAPEAHSGEGIFFTSKVVTRFELTANGLTWIVDNEIEDETIREADDRPGTRVTIRIRVDATVDIAEVFGRFTTDMAYDKTRCVIRLFEHGSRFVARSQAKRLMANLERFRVVEFDFKGIEQVGQGFVDEVFRVWANQHPETEIVPINMGRTVEFMVRRGLPRH